MHIYNFYAFLIACNVCCMHVNSEIEHFRIIMYTHDVSDCHALSTHQPPSQTLSLISGGWSGKKSVPPL